MKHHLVTAAFAAASCIGLVACGGSSTAGKAELVEFCKSDPSSKVDCDCAGAILDRQLSEKDKKVLAVYIANKDIKDLAQQEQKLKDAGLTKEDAENAGKDTSSLAPWIKRRCKVA